MSGWWPPCASYQCRLGRAQKKQTNTISEIFRVIIESIDRPPKYATVSICLTKGAWSQLTSKFTANLRSTRLRLQHAHASARNPCHGARVHACEHGISTGLQASACKRACALKPVSVLRVYAITRLLHVTCTDLRNYMTLAFNFRGLAHKLIQLHNCHKKRSNEEDPHTIGIEHTQSVLELSFHPREIHTWCDMPGMVYKAKWSQNTR